MRFLLVDRKTKLNLRKFPVGILRPDNWNDFGFKTTFQLEVHLSKEESLVIGDVKIMKEGQRAGAITKLPARPFSQLAESYASLGQAYSFYENLKMLGTRNAAGVLSGLRDVVIDKQRRAKFEKEDAFTASLVRASTATAAIGDAEVLFASAQSREMEGDRNFTFETSVGGSSVKVPFEFSRRKEIPGRVNVLIGCNGTGKTRLLANLAMVISRSADLSEKVVANRYGKISDGKAAFSSVSAVSYSAYDTFEIPGRTAGERARVRKSGGVFGYSYNGLRTYLPKQSTNRPPRGLKSADEIFRDFVRAIGRATNRRREDLFRRATAPLARDVSFARIGLDRLIRDPIALSEQFESMSSGHKIVLNIVVQLVAGLEKSSLVLIDEPESHLHPPLLAALVKSINVILEETDSYSIIASHSPVILQEVPARYVHVIERFENKTVVRRPAIETFGENIGMLTREAFNLDSSATEFHITLEKLASTSTMSDVEKMLGGNVSSQARSYLLALGIDRR